MRRFYLLAFQVILPIALFAQPTFQWAAWYHDSQWLYDQVKGIGVDSKNNAYISGYSGNGEIAQPNEYETVKYNTNGVQKWVKKYTGSIANGNNKVYSESVDPSGNVYLTGDSYESVGQSIVTLRYDSLGNLKWKNVYQSHPPTTYNVGIVVGLDNTYNPFVAGNSENVGHTNMATLSINQATGDTIWSRRFAGASGSANLSIDLSLNNNNDLAVAGYTAPIGTPADIVTISYSSSGTQNWLKTYDNFEHTADYAISVAIDHSGNVYTLGFSVNSSNVDVMKLIKYDPSGNLQWVKTIDSSEVNVNDGDLVCDASGNPILVTTVTGISSGSYIAKYSPGGSLLWAKTGAIANGKKILFDQYGSIFIGGNGYGPTPRFGIAKYDPSGNMKWATGYGSDTATIIYSDFAIGSDSSFYFTGTDTSAGFGGLITVKLKQETTTGTSGLADVSNLDLILSPNPVSSTLHVSFFSSSAGNLEDKVYSAAGALVMSDEVYLSEGRNQLELDCSRLPSGIYFLRINNSENSVVRKFVVTEK